MSNSPGNNSDDQIPEQGQAQGHVSIQPNKEVDNLDIWLDNFLAATRDLKEKDDGANRESSEKILTSEEEISAWADKILNGESFDEGHDDEHDTQGQQNDGESGFTGNTDDQVNPQTPVTEKTRSSISITEDEEDDELIGKTPKLTPVEPFDDGDGDSGMERESNPTDGESCNTGDFQHDPVATPSPFNQISKPAFPATTMDDEVNKEAHEFAQTGEEAPGDRIPEFTQWENFEDDDSGVQIKSNQSYGESENAENSEQDPVNKSYEDENEQDQAGANDPAKEILASTPLVPVDNEDGSSETGIGRNENNGEKYSAANGKHDPTTTPIPSTLDKETKSSISIQISEEEDEDDKPAREDEPDGGMRESTPVEQFDNEVDSSETGISSNGTGGESAYAPASPTPNRKARSSTSISISNEDDDVNEQTREGGPFDNEDDDSGKKITRGETDSEDKNDSGGNTQPVPDPSSFRPPHNRRKRSSTSITISNEDEPGENTPEATPARPNDGQGHYSRMGIYDTSDWDEIDLNSESDEEEQEKDTSTPETITGGVNNVEYASYLKAYVDSLYVFGVSTRDGDGKSSCGRWNLIPYFIIVIVALLQAFQFVKNLIISNITENILLHYIKLGYNVNTFLFRGYFAYLMVIKASDLFEIIKAGGALGKRNSKLKAIWLVGFLIITSWILGFSYPMLRNISRMPETWDAKKLILMSAYDFAQTWLSWNITTIDNDTDILWETYGVNITTSGILMAACDVGIDVIGLVYEFFIKDLAFVAAFTMYIICTDFTRKLNSNTQLSQGFCDDIWEHYKLIRTFSTLLNDFFEQLYPLFHLDNLLFTAYVGFEQFFEGGDLQLGMLEICILTKVLCFTWWLPKLHLWYNRKFEKWVRSSFRDTHTMFIENSEKVTTQNLLDEIKSDPIGIGRGMFFIDGSFLWKFTSVVGSFFVFFTEKRQTA